jgi:predicted RNase H-like HicB family nuclease
MAEETESKTGEIGSGGIVGAGLPAKDFSNPAEGCSVEIPEIPSVLNSKEDLEKLNPELRAVIEKLIPSEEEINREREKWDGELEREKFAREFSPETPGSPAEAKVSFWERFNEGFKKLIKRAKIWLKFRSKIGVKYTKTITHDEWMAVRAEPGYFIYNYEYGFIKNPKIAIKSPTDRTDYIMDPKGTGHILVRRGMPIGVGSAFKVVVEIR